MSVVYLGGDGLAVAHVDRRTGTLTLTGTVDGVPGPSWLAFAPDRRFLYCTNELPDGTVTALTLADPAAPKVLGTAPAMGAGPTHLSVHGGFLLTANHTDGTVVAHRLERDGRIGEPTSVVRHPGAEPHAHQVLVDPSGRWVLAVDLGADAVFTYRLDGGALVRHRELRLPAGTGPRHLAFHPDGRRAYLLGELRPRITILAWSAADGTFEPGQVVRTASADNFPAEVTVSGDGRFVYATNRGEDTIASFAVRGAELALIDSVPTGGAWPRHLALGPDGCWVYVANQRSGTVHWLPRDPGTGRLGVPAGSVDVPGAAVTLVG